MRGACVHINLIIARSYIGRTSAIDSLLPHDRLCKRFHTIMSNKPQALGEMRHQLLVHNAGDGHAHERAVCSDNTLECARLALGNEFIAGSSFGLDDFGQGGDLSPFLVRAGK